MTPPNIKRKSTEFGDIPDEWEVKTVVDIKSPERYSVAMGPFGSNIKCENFIPSGVPVIRGTSLNDYRFRDEDFVYVSDQKADELKASNCKSGDLIFTHRGSLGQVGIIPEKSNFPRYVVSQSGMKLTVNKEIVDKNFVFYFFKSKYGQYQLLKNESQVGVPSISNPLTSLKQVEIPIPPLTEQRSIASVLSSLDDKIDLLHRQNKTLEGLAETLFRKRFVEGVDLKWEKGKVGDVLDLLYGKGLKETIRTGSGYPVVGSSGIVDYHKDYLVEAPGIVIGRKGTLGSVNYMYDNFYPIDTTFFVKSKIDSVGLFYEYFLLKSCDFEKMNSDSAVPGLNRDIALATEIDLPDRSTVKEFNSICSSHFTKIYANRLQIRTLSCLRDTLLPKLMSGEVRVRS